MTDENGIEAKCWEVLGTLPKQHMRLSANEYASKVDRSWKKQIRKISNHELTLDDGKMQPPHHFQGGLSRILWEVSDPCKMRQPNSAQLYG